MELTRPGKRHKIQGLFITDYLRRFIILYDWDIAVFNWIYSHFRYPLVEKFMSFITIKQNFIVPGVITLVLVLWFFKKRGLAFLIAAAAFVGLNDFISHNFLKEIVARPRPCHTLPDLQHVVNCSNSYSFPSNHASNLFTAATVTSLSFRKMAFFAYTCALLVGYSRVYLGVHYPSDVLGGAVFGLLMGTLGYLFYKKVRKLLKA